MDMKEEKRKVERRKGPDKWVKSLTWFGVIGWIFMLITMIIFHFARPEKDKAIVGFYQNRLGQDWDASFVPYFITLSIVILFLSVVGLLINSQRRSRKGDSYRVSLILLVIISIFGLLYYLV
jgi:hypothetical protein